MGTGSDLLGDDDRLTEDARLVAAATSGARKRAAAVVEHWREMATNGPRFRGGDRINPLSGREHDRLWEEGDGNVVAALLRDRVRRDSYVAGLAVNEFVARYVPESVLEVAHEVVARANGVRVVYSVGRAGQEAPFVETEDVHAAAAAFAAAEGNKRPFVIRSAYGPAFPAGGSGGIIASTSETTGAVENGTAAYGKWCSTGDPAFGAAYALAVAEADLQRRLREEGWKELCFYSDDGRTVIDGIRGDGHTQCFGKSFAEVRREYPDAVVATFEEASERVAGKLIDAVANPITADAFNDALNMLPPVRWQQFGEVEIFACSEPLYADITTIYVRLGESHFAFSDRMGLPFADIVQKAASAAGRDDLIALARGVAAASVADIERGRYTGPLVGSDSRGIYQDVGRGQYVRHEFGALKDVQHRAGGVLRVEYQGGRVTTKETRAAELGRER